MLKKILSIVVCACVTVEMTSTILASEQINVNENLSKVKCEANISDIIDIPIFIVNSETNITEDIKEDINKSIDEYSGNKAYEFTDKSNEKEIIKDNYTINELTDNEKIDVVNNDLFSETFSQVKKIKDASESELKTYLEGDVYIRTVLIRDLDNRVEGYAYYPWGTTGQSILKQWVDIKYPTRKKSKTTYYYDTRKKFSKKINTKTPGFSGNQSYLDKIYNLYKNKWGQFYDKETLDIGSITDSILEQ